MNKSRKKGGGGGLLGHFIGRLKCDMQHVARGKISWIVPWRNWDTVSSAGAQITIVKRSTQTCKKITMVHRHWDHRFATRFFFSG